MAPSSSSPAISLVSNFFILALLLPISLSGATAGIEGFSIDLIHRDSPRSPFYDPSLTHSGRLRAAFRRSSSRADYIKKSIASAAVAPGSMQSHMFPNDFQYLMTLSIGTPPSKILAIADTASNLIWTQCKPCEPCYKQFAPMFDPTRSITFSNQSCKSDFCSYLPQPIKCGGHNECGYNYMYADFSSADGVLASETFTFESTGKEAVSVPKMIFGCTHKTDMMTPDSRTMGFVGLGGGPLSLISQLGSSIKGKFSYCLVPFEDTNSSSVLSFGKVITGDNVKSTPIITYLNPTFYYLTLEGIKVDNSQVVPAKRSSPEVTTGERIMFESGTTLTYIPDDMLDGLLSTLKSQIGLEPIEDPTGQLNLCYSADSLLDIKIPDVTFQFTGASMVLNPINTFVQITKGVVCLAILSNGQGDSIFGNIAQQNFEIGFDLVEKKLSFAPTDCTKLI